MQPDVPSRTLPTPHVTAQPLVLQAGAVSVVLEFSAGIPRALHWGGAMSPADASYLQSFTQVPQGADGLAGAGAPSVLPQQSFGWMGSPGLEGHRDGATFSTHFEATGCEVNDEPDGTQRVVAGAVDEASALALVTTIDLHPGGLMRLGASLTNTAPTGAYTVNAMRLGLPVPTEARELLDFAGRHLRERTPQRHPFVVGTHLREGRRGRTGSDATVLLAAGTPGFGFRSGEVWAVHTAWSGNHATYAELGLNGIRMLGGGEVLLPGEVRLDPGETYSTPWLYAAYGEGLDAIAAAFHTQLRSRPSHPTSARRVVLNTREAVYFDHDLASLTELAELGAEVGAERFVLDDGWFRRRRHDRAGLGDWEVDPDVWPDGLEPLVTRVRDLGMEFGLWFEPEMVNEDSDLARAHPDWILAPGERLPLRGRSQQVLNLTVPAAYRHVLESMSAIITEHDVEYIKWDHNRDLVEAGDRSTARARVHAQTLAVYALMDELRRRHPLLEIESCSSGGGRVDLGVLQRADRVWASDCIDALERQQIQRWTGLLLPPELVGSHVGAATAHTTHRTHSLAFRAATALFGHFGIEWDLRLASKDELTELTDWVDLYKEERELIHTGTSVHCDLREASYWAHGVVSADRSRALFAFVSLDTGIAAQPGRIRLPGLDPRTVYRIEPVHLSSEAVVRNAAGPPAWWTDPSSVSGRTLASVGLQAPMLYPEQALVLRLETDSAAESRR